MIPPSFTCCKACATIILFCAVLCWNTAGRLHASPIRRKSAKKEKPNSTSTSIVYDKTAPSVSGVKNGKTYKKAVAVKVKDKYGLKKITLNGKKFTSGKKVTKKGSYTLKAVDKAGNVKTVKFKLK